VQPLLMKSWQQNTSSAFKQGKVTNSTLEMNNCGVDFEISS